MQRRAASGRPVSVLAALAAAGALAGAAAATQAAAPAPARATVVLRDIAFQREATRIRVGGRVTWSWEDPYARHDLHAVGRPRFRGATARRTGTHTVRFTRAGTYRYACFLHPGMDGRIVVR